MKQPILALAALASLGLAVGAKAESNVQVYGLIDAGVEVVNNASATGGSATRVISGGKNSSRWGFRVSEDLGDGLKALVQLEGGVLMDTGNMDGVLFKRQATVGVEGGFGRVLLGRSFTTTYDFMIQVDPLGFAPNYSWSTSGAATGPSKYGMTTQFDNLVKYYVKAGDLQFGATVALGEQPGSTADSRKVSIGGAYRIGNLNAVATWEQINGNVVVATGRRDETTVWHLAGDYREGQWRLGAGARIYKLVAGKAATPDVRADTTWLGVSYLPQPDVTLTAAVYHVNVKNVAAGQDADPTLLVTRGMLALSKRTDLYLALAHASGKNNKLVGVSRDDPGFGTTQTGLTAGIQHRF